MAVEELTPQKRFVKQEVITQPERFAIKISPIIKNIIEKAKPDPKLPKRGYQLAQQVALGELVKLSAKTGPRVLRAQIQAIGQAANLEFTPEIIEGLLLEISQPLKQVMAGEKDLTLPDEVQKNLPPEPEELEEESPPLSSQLKTLSRRGRRLVKLESQLEEELHPCFRLMANGVFLEDLEATTAGLNTAYQKAGYTDDQIQQDPVMAVYSQIRDQMRTFQEIRPKVTKSLQKVHEASRKIGLDVSGITQKFKLPYFNQAIIKVEKITKPLGWLRGLDQAFGRVVSGIGNKLATSRIGGAVIGAVQKIGGAVAKATAKATAKGAVKLAAKAGIKLSASAIGAVLPTGVTQVMAILGTISAVLDALETIPLIGPIIKKIRQFSPLKLLWKAITWPFKKISQGLKEGKPEDLIAGIAALAIPLTAAGLVIAGPIAPLILIGGTLAAIGGIWLVSNLVTFVPRLISGVGSTITGLASTINAFLIALPALIPFIVPIGLIIGIILAVIGLVIFIVVLIAGGSFLVTPRRLPVAEFGELQSQYFSVEKTAEPGYFSSEELDQIWNSGRTADVIFTITITTADRDITITSIDDNFFVYPDGPAIPSSGLNISLPLEVAAGTETVYQYQISFNSSYRDTVVNNRIIATADIRDGPSGEQSSSSAGVILGEAPTLCFVFEGNWTPEDQAREIRAIGVLSQWPNFVNLLCGDGQITLERGSGSEFGGRAPSANRIIIYDLGLGSHTNTLYTLAHESGHLINFRNSNLIPSFRSSGATAQEGYICSYGYGFQESEDFAESIGIYPVWQTRQFRNYCLDGGNMSCNYREICSINYPNDYPIHYNFVNNQIYSP